MEELTTAEQLGMLFACRVKPKEWKLDKGRKRLVEISLPAVVDDAIKIMAGDGSLANMETIVVQMLIGLGATMLVVETNKSVNARLKERRSEDEEGQLDNNSESEERPAQRGDGKCGSCTKCH